MLIRYLTKVKCLVILKLIVSRTLDPRLLGKISRINVGQAFFYLLIFQKQAISREVQTASLLARSAVYLKLFGEKPNMSKRKASKRQFCEFF